MPWDGLLEQLQSFDAELSQHDREPGDVSARLREICDQARSHRICHDGHDDGDAGRGVLGRLGHCDVSDNHIDSALDQVSGQLR
jgi:hypothetical protein